MSLKVTRGRLRDLTLWVLATSIKRWHVQEGGDAADVADEIERTSDFSLPSAETKPPSELLDEDPAAVGDPGEADDVDVGDVDALVEDVGPR